MIANQFFHYYAYIIYIYKISSTRGCKLITQTKFQIDSDITVNKH